MSYAALSCIPGIQPQQSSTCSSNTRSLPCPRAFAQDTSFAWFSPILVSHHALLREAFLPSHAGTNLLLYILPRCILYSTFCCCYFTIIWFQSDEFHFPHKTVSLAEQRLPVFAPHLIHMAGASDYVSTDEWNKCIPDTLTKIPF